MAFLRRKEADFGVIALLKYIVPVSVYEKGGLLRVGKARLSFVCACCIRSCKLSQI